MKKLQQLKDESIKDFDTHFGIHAPKGKTVLTIDEKNVKDFIDSIITKAYEAGKNDSTEHECISDGNMYLSNPSQNKCKICGKFFR